MQALQELVAGFVKETGLFPEGDAVPAGDYLFYEITNGNDWAVSQEADKLLTEFERHLVKKGSESEFSKAQKPLKANPHSHYQLVRDWVRGLRLSRRRAWRTFRGWHSPAHSPRRRTWSILRPKCSRAGRCC